MAFDFSKLGKMTSEEMAERDRERAVFEQQKELNERAAKAVLSRKFLLIEDPEMRSTMSGDTVVVLRGPDFNAVMKSLPHEDSRNLQERVSQIAKGDEIKAHGHMEKRNWKDQKGSWRSTEEFVVDLPVSPPGLKNDVLEGVDRPMSVFTQKQQQIAQQQMGR